MAEVILSTKIEFVPAADIPAMIANALHPDASDQPRTVSYFIKFARLGATGETAKWDGWPIDDDDRKVLADICGSLPPENGTDDEVQPYLETFKANSTELDWEVSVCWNNPKLIADLYRINAEREHLKALVSAIRHGQLQVLNPATRLPVNEYQANAVVSLDNLTKYLAQFQIGVRQAVLADELPEIYKQQEEIKRTAGRYTLEEAAHFIEQETGERANELQIKLMAAAHNGLLPVYEPGKKSRYAYGDGLASSVRKFYEEAYWHDLNSWLETYEPLIEVIFPNPNAPAIASKVEPVRGLTKQRVINVFDGMHYNRDKWGKYLGDPPDWLKDCRIALGSRGKKASATWNPVLIAAALYDRRIPLNKLDAVFVGLKDWSDEWREKSEAFRD